MADPTMDLEGVAAIPRSNGEPVFSAPWQGRAFGMAMALHEQGAFEWERFRLRLIDEIAAGEAAAGSAGALEDDDGSLYYSRWLVALSGVLDEAGLVAEPELAAREDEYRNGVRREVY